MAKPFFVMGHRPAKKQFFTFLKLRSLCVININMIKQLILIILFSGLAHGSPQLENKTEYYHVSPKTISGLLNSLNNSSPIRQNGKTFHANTESFVEWNWRWNLENGKCKMVKISSKVEIRFTFPKLNMSDTSTEVISVWDRWFPKLIQHENNHASHAVKIANIGEERIFNIRPQSSCSALDNEATTIANQLNELLNEMDKTYDKKTNHGKTEGAAILSYL